MTMMNDDADYHIVSFRCNLARGHKKQAKERPMEEKLI